MDTTSMNLNKLMGAAVIVVGYWLASDGETSLFMVAGPLALSRYCEGQYAVEMGVDGAKSVITFFAADVESAAVDTGYILLKKNF